MFFESSRTIGYSGCAKQWLAGWLWEIAASVVHTQVRRRGNLDRKKKMAHLEKREGVGDRTYPPPDGTHGVSHRIPPPTPSPPGRNPVDSLVRQICHFCLHRRRDSCDGRYAKSPAQRDCPHAGGGSPCLAGTAPPAPSGTPLGGPPWRRRPTSAQLRWRPAGIGEGGGRGCVKVGWGRAGWEGLLRRAA